MAKTKEIKTNAMRILESMKIPYAHLTYECDEFTDGLAIADMLSLPYEKVYKTLVTSGSRGEKQRRDYYVFVIPVAQELDLKAAARSVGVKSVEMIHVKDINKITGYIRGGCTAVGMKKQYVTRIDSSAQVTQTLSLSGQVLDYAASGNHCALLSGSRLTLYDQELDVQATLDNPQGARYMDLAPNGSALLANDQQAWLYIPQQ